MLKRKNGSLIEGERMCSKNFAPLKTLCTSHSETKSCLKISNRIKNYHMSLQSFWENHFNLKVYDRGRECDLNIKTDFEEMYASVHRFLQKKRSLLSSQKLSRQWFFKKVFVVYKVAIGLKFFTNTLPLN